ncbi:MAG TPA: hypothetical protein VKR06_05545 [Ktedonosporobacter sp.]|nr:hypothetical protein [Ktedonosporobacter sp.]
MKKYWMLSLVMLAACLLVLVSTLAFPVTVSHAQLSTPSGIVSTAPSFDQSLIDSAVSQPLFAFPSPTSASPRPGDGPSEVFASKAIYFMALVTWYNPQAKASNGTSVASRLSAQIGNLVVGGHEPDANGSLEGWSHNDIVQAILLAKNEPIVWNGLTGVQKVKLDLLVQALAIAGNWQFNDRNNFGSDLDGLCHFNKSNNPNYREGYVGIVIAASAYFGASQLNLIFTTFSYTSFTKRLQAAGFTNIISTWAHTGATLMTGGGKDACGGSGAGAKQPFVYQGATLSDPVGIFSKLAFFTYQDTVTSSGANGQAFIVGHKISPCQGLMGMEHEFNSSDSGGPRSDALYAFEGWMNSLSTRTTLTVLGLWGSGSRQQDIQTLMRVGSVDLLYKLSVGYEGHFLGQQRLVNETTPATDGPSSKGFFFDQQVWHNVLAPGTSGTTCR